MPSTDIVIPFNQDTADGLHLLALSGPFLPGTIELPDVPVGGFAAEAAVLVSLAVGTALALMGEEDPKKVKKQQIEQDVKDNQRVIKVKEVHDACDAALTGLEIAKLMGRIAKSLAGPPRTIHNWLDAEELQHNLGKEIFDPLIEAIMKEVRKRVLQQMNGRVNGTWTKGTFKRGLPKSAITDQMNIRKGKLHGLVPGRDNPHLALPA
jgi:hypothetical protein